MELTLPYEWMGLVMFAGALLLLASGYPVAFSLGGTAIVFGIVGISLDIFEPALLQAMPARIFGTMSNYTLLAIPYFIFLGSMLEKTGIAEDLLETMGILFGPLRGGLALAVVVVGALLAATTGVVAATVVAMGLISLPLMLRYNYNKELATGVICASGTLGQIIPPSVVLVVLGDQLGISVGDLFIGALIPGVITAGLFAVYCVTIAAIKPNLAPALPLETRTMSGQALFIRVIQVMIPPLILIVLVLGSIFFGIATPTEAGALGALGATILGLVNRKLTWKALRSVVDSTLRITTMVVFILIGSTAFSLIFRGLNGDVLLFDLLVNLPGGWMGFLAVCMFTVFFLGFFIDFFEIAFIIVPLFVPVAEALGINLVWFGVLIGANLQASFLTPPFGFALFYLRGVSPPEVTTPNIYRGALPFIGLQMLIVFLIILFPDLVLYLPSLAR